MIAHDELLSRVSLHAIGALDGDELRELRRHLAEGCETCNAALLEAEGLAGDLTYGLDPVQPSEVSRRLLVNRVRAEAARPTRAGNPATAGPSIPGWMPWLAAAAVVVAAFLGTQVRSLDQRLRDEQVRAERLETQALRLAGDTKRYASEAEALRNAASQLDGQFANVEAVIETLTSPSTVPVALGGKGAAKEAKARAFLDPDRRRLFLYVYDLPELPKDRTYQLWVIVEDNPVSAGVFETDENGSTRFRADEIPKWKGKGAITIAVSEEPAGGAPQPTGSIMLAGTTGS